jgi:branched-chain amino acid transport system permease protein
MLGWGLNIVVGLAGLLDSGYVAFYAVGAYAYALLATSDPGQGLHGRVGGRQISGRCGPSGSACPWPG